MQFGAFMLPSVKLQTTFRQLLKPSVIICALLLKDSRIDLLQRRFEACYYHLTRYFSFVWKVRHIVQNVEGSIFNLSAEYFMYEMSPGLGGFTISPICKLQNQNHRMAVCIMMM